MIGISELMVMARKRNASDIHLTFGVPPILRIDGVLTEVADEALDDAYTENAARELMSPEQLEVYRRDGEADLAVTAGGSRIRVNVFRQQGHTALALRLLPLRVPTAAELQIPQVLIRMAELPRGLILITGPTGSGKSSTLAALLNHINQNFKRHIITLENPIEYVHTRVKCIINQREIGPDTGSFSAGLRAALRQDPDVILVGEMRDLETISTAITAAETGHLVFGTLHTKGVVNTVDRIIDVFPAEQQDQIRMQLAEVLECVIGQTLLPCTKGGRRAVFEVMTGTSAVKSLIRQNKSYQLSTAIQTSRKLGMILLDNALADLVRAGEVSLADAMAAANEPESLGGAQKMNL